MERLETLLNHLEFKVDVISLTETCNPETKNHTCNPKVLEGYKNDLGILGIIGIIGIKVNSKRWLWVLPK